MKAAWRVYRVFCVAGFSLVLLASVAILVMSALNDAVETPTATSLSPDGRMQLLVFSAGQGNLPPDYRADVRFVLYDKARLPGFRGVQVARAAFADGWAVKWNGPRAVTIEAGRLSWFDRTASAVWGVAVTVHVAESEADERACVGQNFGSAIDGVICFDGLLHRPAAPAH